MKKVNIIFLDYDGVINTSDDIVKGIQVSKEAIFYINKLCLEKHFSIVFSSAWSKKTNYKELLYNSGIDEDIKILGTTNEELHGQIKEVAVADYLKNNKNINKFLIIDDGFPGQKYKNNFIQTIYKKGFNKDKYLEAIKKLEEL